MDIITMKLLENKLCMDLLRYINTFVYEKLTDENIHQAVKLWIKNEEKSKVIYGHISYWNVANVTNMYKLFSGTSFNCDISRWNVSNVTNMSYMFCRATSFNSDISKWNVSNVQDMESMFFLRNLLILTFQTGM